MLILYDKNEKQFVSNGIGRLDKYAFDDEVVQELNGIYKLEFSYPIFSKHSNHIITDNIVRATTPDSEQPFFISRIVKKDGYLRVIAYHIFYKLIWELIEDINIVGLNGQGALNRILENTEFVGLSDISKTSNIRIVRYNVVEALLNQRADNTYISRFGGEIIRDKFTIEIRNRIGRYYSEFPSEIRYAKNLLSYEVDIDQNNIATRVMPLGFNGLLIPEKYVIKPGADLEHLKTLKVEYPSIKAAADPDDIQEDELLLEDAYEALRQAVLLDFENGRFDVKANYRIEFQDLATTEEYKNNAVLQRLYLGDETLVVHEDDGLNILSRVISYRWSPLRKEYNEIELGTHQERFTDLKPTLEIIAEKIEQYKTDYEKNIEEVTLLLTTALGGHVLKGPGELFIMDTDDPNTAQKVWRWNLNGLGYSGVGIDGPYEIAITMEGRILAKFIQTNNLSAISADLGEVVAGLIRSADGSSYWDLNTGDINLNVSSLTINGAGAATDEDLNNLAGIVGDIANDLVGKASDGELQDLVDAYNARVAQEITDKQAVSDALATLEGRVNTVNTILGDKTAKWEFIETTITAAEEGIFIGNESTQMGVLVGAERISFIDKGTEVAYISNKTMQINHGIFVESAIIGKHKIETIPGTNITVFTFVG